jgi:divalent metal cation (Fe/Co/Zn/Cd) transporter
MTDVERLARVRTGVRLEVMTVVWMVVEAVVSLGAGVAAGSVLLVAFGLDSIIELLSGTVLLWRLSVEARGGDAEDVEIAEHRAAWVAAVLLLLLCVYVVVSSLYGLVSRSAPGVSPVGIGIAAAAVLAMPWLGVKKRALARDIESDALEDDAAESFACAYMAGTVLLGLVLNAVFHWWWVEDAAALLFLVWLGRETWEALEEARGHE